MSLVWTTDDITFSRLIRPSSMRSSYWTFFGFPADAQNQIITRRKIVCTLCNKAVAYNRNTTNLKVHLSSQHPELDITSQPKLKRVKYVHHPVDEDDENVEEVSSSRQPMVLAETEDVSSMVSCVNHDFSVDAETDEGLRQDIIIEECDTEEVGYKIEYIDESDFVDQIERTDDMESHARVESVVKIDLAHEEDKERSDAIDKAFENLLISSLSTEFAEGNEFREFCSLLNYVVPEQQIVSRFLKSCNLSRIKYVQMINWFGF